MGNLSWSIPALITISIFLASVIYRLGHVSARVEELERWRITIRADMREISDVLEKVRVELVRLRTVIEERTEKKE